VAFILKFPKLFELFVFLGARVSINIGKHVSEIQARYR
jgi:hypothetical protein